MIGSVGDHLVPYLSGLTAAGAWTFLGSRFAPLDAQATLRVLREFCLLRLTSAEPVALDAFELKYYNIVARIDQLKVDVSTICLAHLLSALPPSLDSRNTYMSAHYRKVLPSVTTIFGLVMEEILQSHQVLTASRSTTGLATQALTPSCPKPVQPQALRLQDLALLPRATLEPGVPQAARRRHCSRRRLCVFGGHT